jgi:tetratricopeptide (TPR) repeat protein
MQGLLQAMQGDFEHARASVGQARSLNQDLGKMFALAAMTDVSGDVEWYAGDMANEERERRSGYEALRAMRAESYQATWAAWLARPLVDLGRDEEALRLTLESERLAAQEDITAEVPWREARARILARRGEMNQAERLARDAVSIAERTDWLNLQGDAHMALADVLRLVGRLDEAGDAAQRALDRYERKGNIVAMDWARDLLRELGLRTSGPLAE